MDDEYPTEQPKTSYLPNNLANETSPYLLEHATNPVNWFPWGPTALELAKKQDKPILLSIGYSACHWCHVMMHESFEDPNVAATMNRLFINIKVDKEERPDIDKIYQTSHQLLMGRSGGWPLTMFLSPLTLIPYYGGTYFPKDAQEEIPDFEALLHRLNDIYYHDKEKIRQQELHVLAILQVISQPRVASEHPLAAKLRHEAELVLQTEFDPVYSGFGTEAKFPNCPALAFLLASSDPLIRHMPLVTLKHMAESGLYDHLAGGFFRYTVDQKWHIPHFEKMLYDNAQLLSILAIAYQDTNNHLYKSAAVETANWLLTTMRDEKSKCFYTSIDADNPDGEGSYYVWDLEEIKSSLNAAEFASIKKYYKLDHKANFDHQWHLIIEPNASIPSTEQLNSIKQKLLNIRQLRTQPNVDTKILTSANSLVIKGFCEAGLTLQLPEYTDIATQAFEFIKQNLFIEQKLFATWQNGVAKIPGFLDDYAFLLDATLTLINNQADHPYLEFCQLLADSLIENFYDQEHGGFFFVAHTAEKLFYNPKVFTDDAIPAGNSIACIALIKLGRILDKAQYIEIAKNSINTAQVYLNDAPEVHLSLCDAYTLLHQATNDKDSFPQKSL